ncbi:DNA adenine methylase [Metamycoplasma equirhinis]|uniref:DNA adenine methylase n=1 Tax=Metamycoplasma equirhinis TaxID=92402 RepID=UPI0035948F6A
MFFRGGTIFGYINSKEYILNDINSHLISLIKLFYNNDALKIINDIQKNIEEYKLFLEIKNDKKQVNKTNYNLLKNTYNQIQNKNTYKANVMLLTLVIYGFNSQIRFNQKGEFNIPAGKQEFNDNRKQILLNFVNKIKNKNVIFSNKDFRFVYELLKTKEIDDKTFLYFDPPYLITNATYNNIWTENEEIELLNLLDELSKNNIKWALSNVLASNGKNNQILIEWSKKYYVHNLNKTYKNSNYQRKNNGKDWEVLITNYENK